MPNSPLYTLVLGSDNFYTLHITLGSTSTFPSVPNNCGLSNHFINSIQQQELPGKDS